MVELRVFIEAQNKPGQKRENKMIMTKYATLGGGEVAAGAYWIQEDDCQFAHYILLDEEAWVYSPVQFKKGIYFDGTRGRM